MENKNLENSLNKSRLRTIFSILQSIFVFGIIIAFILNLVVYFFLLPKKTLLKSYESDNYTVYVYKYTIRFIGKFSDKRVYAEDKNDFFSCDDLLYITESLINDSLSIVFLNDNIIRIDAYVNDTIIQELSCEYDYSFETEPCSFLIGEPIVQH